MFERKYFVYELEELEAEIKRDVRHYIVFGGTISVLMLLLGIVYYFD